MTILTLLLIPIMMLVGCSSDNTNSAASSANPLSSQQDNARPNQYLEADGKYSKASDNERKKTTHSNNTYYKSKANVVHIPGSKQVKVNIDDALVVINLIDDDGSYLDFKKGNNYLNKFTEISFNYTYDTDLEAASQKIKVFKSESSDQGLLILPEGTEEYPTYTILPFDETGIKHSYNAEIQSFDCDNFDRITLNTATLDANATILDHSVAQSISISQDDKGCKVNVSDSKVLKSLAAAKQESQVKKLQPFTSNELAQTYDSNLYQFYNFDVNADGIKDKIITHKNNKNNIHQGNDLFVYVGDINNKYQLTLKTNNFTDDNGWSLYHITPRSDSLGFILTSYFADRGHSEQSFYFGLQNDEWLMTKYVSAGKLITGSSYYCIENHNSVISDVGYEKSNEYNEAEFKKYCPPLASRYKVTANKAEILDQDFNPQISTNYYIKGDVIEAVAQNQDWIKVSYKQDSKYGWVDKGSLKALS